MFGYACRETPELMPLTVSLSHRLVRQLSLVRKEGILPYLRPDGKSQVTIEYEFGKPKRAHAVVVAAQHDPDVSLEQLSSDIQEHVVGPVLGQENPAVQLDCGDGRCLGLLPAFGHGL